LTVADLNGQGNWVATSAAVQATEVHNGPGQAASLTDDASTAVQVLNSAETEVWTDLYIKPVFGAGDATVDTPPAGSTFAFYVNTNGNVVVHNGASQQVLTKTVLADTWVRFTVHSNSDTEKWDLAVDGTQEATGLDFINSASGYTEFGLQGAATAYVDDINITLSSPLEARGTIFRFR
jgi:hypothetical protein